MYDIGEVGEPPRGETAGNAICEVDSGASQLLSNNDVVMDVLEGKDNCETICRLPPDDHGVRLSHRGM